MDVHTPEQRRRNMAAIKGKNTKPELEVRKLIHRLGYRYALDRDDLPGKPDITFPSRRKIIFVHGCYWHMHDCRWGRVIPATRTDFWQAKRTGNVRRDQASHEALVSLGWEVLVVWECEIKNPSYLTDRLIRFLQVHLKQLPQAKARKPAFRGKAASR